MHIKGKKARLKHWERVTSRFILAFVIYAYLYVTMELLFPIFNDIVIVGMKIYIPLYAILSLFVVGYIIKKKINLLNYLYDEKFDEGDILTIILRSAGIGMLYFLFQMSMMLYFFPMFADVLMYDNPLYLPLFIANGSLVAMIYFALYSSEIKSKRSNPFANR